MPDGTVMTAIILQARLDSSRLPRKALLPLGGAPLVLRVMEALARIPAALRILACPEDAVDPFKALAASAGFEIFGGSKDDVLGRFCAAIRHFSLEGEGLWRIIRATGDNPFVFRDAAEAINREAASLGADYSGFAALPYGAGVESVAVQALLRAEREAETPYHKEHVCPYMYENGGVFTLHRPLAPAKWRYPAMRLSVDTAADYENAKLLYTELLRCALPEERALGECIAGAYNRIFPPSGTASA
jgi:spore coat polysaccharide biosynthesis protein SpsF